MQGILFECVQTILIPEGTSLSGFQNSQSFPQFCEVGDGMSH